MEEQLADVERPDWDTYFLLIAKIIALRSTCTRAQVGALIVDNDNRIIATGYNGAPSGEPHCIDIGCLEQDGHCIRTVHAEENALMQASESCMDVDGYTLYYWDSANRASFSIEELKEHCSKCGEMAEGAGIARVMGVGDDYLELE